MKRRIYLIRHGQTDLNKQGIVQGKGMDAPLNDFGRSQANQFYQAYKELDFDLICHSSLQRSRQSIEQFLPGAKRIWERPEIDEISWGIHEGQRPNPHSGNLHSEVVAEWQSGNYNAKIPEGECAIQLQDRLLRFSEELLSADFNQALICSHGRTMRALLCVLTNTSLDQMEAFPHRNLCLYLLEEELDGFKPLRSNDIAHLA